MKSETISTILFGILLGALVYLECREVTVLERMATMTDPGPMELKASWIHAYDGTTPIYHVISVIRNAPSETVTDWEARFQATIKHDLTDSATKPYGT